MKDYSERRYLSAIEVAKFLKIKVRDVHSLTKSNILPAKKSTSGQFRYSLKDLKKVREVLSEQKKHDLNKSCPGYYDISLKNTNQKIYISNSQNMKDLKDNSVHLVITSPPYFNAKMYSDGEINNDLGRINVLNNWLEEIGFTWKEVYRVLQPGRKFFLNIMNLPVRMDKSYRNLNLVGKSIDLCEEVGFIFKRDIIWHKTNGVRAHFGTYPYPGGILINNMHEFILEFNKPEDKGFKKYGHITKEIKEKSKLDKDFWLSIKNSDVWLMNPEKSGDGRGHIAPFPLELPNRLIKAFSYIGETILDPFGGSGTTLLSASNLERNGIMYEINPEIAQYAKTRIIESLDS